MAIILNTIKGKGIKEFENDPVWHAKKIKDKATLEIIIINDKTVLFATNNPPIFKLRVSSSNHQECVV